MKIYLRIYKSALNNVVYVRGHPMRFTADPKVCERLAAEKAAKADVLRRLGREVDCGY